MGDNKIPKMKPKTEIKPKNLIGYRHLSYNRGINDPIEFFGLLRCSVLLSVFYYYPYLIVEKYDVMGKPKERSSFLFNRRKPPMITRFFPLARGGV